MDWLQTIVLAIVQGITEFLPISSSAHLILFPKLFGWPDQGLGFDIAVHFGTFIAVCHYFRGEIIKLLYAWFGHILHGKSDENSRLAWTIIIATIPIVIIGLMLGNWVELNLRSPIIIAWASIVFGIFLWLADRLFDQSRKIESMTYKSAILIGLAQILAMIPGVSRSGITMTAARGLGFNRSSAATFSFLLAIPTIFLAFIWQSAKFINSTPDIQLSQLTTAVCISAIIAWLSIHFFLSWIKKTDMSLFVIYRIVLGIVLLIIFR